MHAQLTKVRLTSMTSDEENTLIVFSMSQQSLQFHGVLPQILMFVQEIHALLILFESLDGIRI